MFQKKLVRSFLFVTLGLLLLLAACTPVDEIIPGTGDQEIPETVESARLWLSQQIGVDLTDVALVRAEAAEWSDSCLGLGRPNESCAQVQTSGWVAVFDVGDQTFEVRINDAGTDFRVAEWAQTPIAPETPMEETPAAETPTGETPAETPMGTPEATAAATGAVTGTATTGAADLAGTRWELVSFGAPGEETPVLGETPLTLEFMDPGQAGGEGGCNSFSVAYKVESGRLVFEDVISTLMACQDEAVTNQEQQYLEALATAGEYELQGDQLTIYYNDRQGVLNFERLAEGE